MKFYALARVLLLLTPGAMQGQPTSSPAPPAESAHAEGVDRRGDQGMGFSHEMTRHHFRLSSDGGSIEVEAKNPNDATSREAIRTHLAGVATLFRQGNFSLPMFIHATEPPGMKTMRRLKDKITYSVENTPRGAAVTIKTSSAEAVQAIHDFLRFQIEEHRTGDQPAS